MSQVLYFEEAKRHAIEKYLPRENSFSRLQRPHVTLTYAASLDSQIALAPGTATALSGPESKAMTHFLRTRHDAILIGSGTAIADNPTLNSRLNDTTGRRPERQPRPVILDRRGGGT